MLTKHSPGWDRFSVQPEGHLGENNCHDARQVRLNDKVANLPLQMEMSRHHCVLTCTRKKSNICVKTSYHSHCFHVSLSSFKQVNFLKAISFHSFEAILAFWVSKHSSHLGHSCYDFFYWYLSNVLRFLRFLSTFWPLKCIGLCYILQHLTAFLIWTTSAYFCPERPFKL